MGNLIHSASRAQSSVALSITESDLYAMCSAASEALYLRNLMVESGISDDQVITNLQTDSSAAKSLVSRSGPGRKTRRIQMKYLYLQDLIQDGQVKIFKVKTENTVADILTKYLSGEIMEKLSSMISVHEHQLDKSQNL